MADILSLMNKHSKAFKNAEAPDMTPLPDGTFQFKIYKTAGKAIIVKDSDGAYRARIGLEVVAAATGDPNLDTKCVGRKTTKSWNLFGADETPDERGFGYLKADLVKMGIDADELELPQLGEALEGLVGAVIDAKVATKQDKNGNDRQNVWINGLASEASPSKAAPKGKAARKF